MKFKPNFRFFAFFLFVFIFECACNAGKNNGKLNSDDLSAMVDLNNKGIGPIKQYVLKEINLPLMQRGKGLFKARCENCHKIEQRFIGPALKGITEIGRAHV